MVIGMLSVSSYLGLYLFLCCHSSHVLVTALSSTTTTTTSLDISKIRAISFDVTGTLLATKEPVIKSYHDAAIWAQLSNLPTQNDFKSGFGPAFRERCLESPCFGGVEGISGREWWMATVRRVLDFALKNSENINTNTNDECYYTEQEFQRYFRRVYQHFGSPAGYMVLEDAASLLSTIDTSAAASASSKKKILGITSNTPIRHMESILPMLDNLHDKFSWFTCSQEVGHEKPAGEIFDDAYQKAKFWLDDPDLKKDEILHIGDSYTCDYCGAKAYGFQALLLDRSDHPSVTAYQDWLTAPDYEGKSLEDVERNTITSLEEVANILMLSNQKENLRI
jgi:HAD superfamily hydrolase (TIGR01549 family)